MKFKSMRLIPLVLCFVSMVLLGSTTIKNSKKPASVNPGRQIPLKLVATIEDDGETFFFKWPSGVRIAPNGTIFVMDQDQLLKLNPQGKLLQNLWKKGQGPTEMEDLSNYFLLPGDEVLAHNAYPNKILIFNSNGKCIYEKRLEPNNLMVCFHVDKDNYYFWRESIDGVKNDAQEVLGHRKLMAVSRKDNSIKELGSYSMTNYVITIPEGVFNIRTTQFLIKHLKKNLAVISHSSEYQIKLVDLNTGKLLIEFTRDYDRVKVTKENEEYTIHGNVGKYKSPIPKYLHDIQSFHSVNGKLWVITNTVTEKGVLVDVFDDHGKYLDNFYLRFQFEKTHHKLEQSQLTIFGNYIYVIERNLDDDYVISKYEMAGGSL